MRTPAQIETKLFVVDERRPQPLDGNQNLVDVARDWGVETAAECGGAGLRPIWRPADDESCGERRGLRFGMYRRGDA
jgi:hypothetical protein